MAQINTSAINFGLTRPELSNALLQGYQQSQAFEQDLAQKQLQNQAMTQELQSQAQAQQALAGGIGITDPRLLQYGKRGMEVFKTGIAAQKSNIETLQKRLDVIGSAAGVVRSNPTVENFSSVLRDLVNNGAMTMAEAQQALAETGNDPAKIKTYADKAFTQALSAKDQIAKYFSQDVGGAYQIMGVDPVTGKANVVSRTGKSLTPGQALEQQQWQQIMGGGGGAGFGAGAAPTGGAAPVGAAPAGAAPAGAAPARINALMPGVEGADTTTVSDAGSPRNVLQQVAAIDAEVARLSNLPGKPAADRIQSLLAIKDSLMKAEQFKMGSTQTAVITDPATGQPVTVLGRVDPVTQQFTPIEAKPPGMTVDGKGATSNIVRAPETAVEAKRREAFEALPGAVQSAENAVNLITRMVGDTSGKIKPHPGFQDFVGATYKPGARFIPGTNASDFQGLHNQITGRAFLEAFETLKGGGAITEAEGTKATQAITRMSASLSEEEYLKAAREFQGIVEAGLKRAKAKLQGQRPGATPPVGGGGGGGAKADPLGIR